MPISFDKGLEGLDNNILTGTLENVVKIVVYFKDIRHFPHELEVRKRLFGDGPYPVATVVQVANLGLDDLLVEIDATAVLD